jgi:c(7)-type cytochrome triheme protein
MKKPFLLALLFTAMAGVALAQVGVKKKRQPPHEYGKVVINNYSEKVGLKPVQFDHWIHRSKYTCRLCHMDIGFAMRAGETQVKAADNMRGYFCGTCHNGTMRNGERPVFRACAKEFSKEEVKTCERCHRTGTDQKREAAFERFAEKMPRERYGNGINWEQAEQKGLIKPVDVIEGVSIKKAPLATQKDFAIEAKIEGIPQIIFSHRKHTIWNGCEVCHPEIFIGTKKGVDKYSMVDLFQGKYCGVCHDTVAFPQTDCQRCHAKPV